MLRSCFLTAVFCTLIQALPAAEPTQALRFSTNRFSIKPLEPSDGTEPQQPLIMFLTASDGFAPNVNIQIQPFDGTIGDYMATSEKEFQAAKLTVLKKTKVGRSGVTYKCICG